MVMVSRDQEQCLSWLCLSDRFVGNLLKGQTVGVIGAGRIGSAYARMMVIPYFLKYFQIECVKTLCRFTSPS